jgi:hypothetical protein
MPPPKKGGRQDSRQRPQEAVKTEKRRAKRKAGAPRGPLHAVSVLCHGCVLDRGALSVMSRGSELGCHAVSVLCHGCVLCLRCVERAASVGRTLRSCDCVREYTVQLCPNAAVTVLEYGWDCA